MSFIKHTAVFSLCIFLPICATLYSCNSSAKKSVLSTSLSDTQKAYERTAQEKYGDSISYDFNDSRSHVICSRKDQLTTAFFIYDIKAGKILYENSMQRVFRLRWNNNTRIEIAQSPGGPASGTGSLQQFFYDVESKELTEGKEKAAEDKK